MVTMVKWLVILMQSGAPVGFIPRERTYQNYRARLPLLPKQLILATVIKIVQFCM